MSALTRTRIAIDNYSEFINFCSNDYLSLAKHPEVINNFQQGALEFGFGSGGSNLITGYTSLHQQLEQEFAKFIGAERALLFNTGYMANLGVITSLLNRNSIVLQDRENHASLIDAAILSRAKLLRYSRNNLKIIDNYSNISMLASDGVFSMSGQIAPLDKLIEQIQHNNPSSKKRPLILIDDAHGLGVLGKCGKGILEHYNLSIQGSSASDHCNLDYSHENDNANDNNSYKNKIDILVCPLGKAFGGLGAMVAGSHTLIEQLIQKSRQYIYTTSLPAAVVKALLISLKILQQEPNRVTKLQQLIQIFTEKTKQYKLPFRHSHTAIQSIVLHTNENAVKLSTILKQHKILALAIRPPTVPINQAQIRITLNYKHTEEQIDNLLAIIAKYYR